MNQAIRDDLLQTLARFGDHAPDVRLGQLIANLAFLADPPAPRMSGRSRTKNSSKPPGNTSGTWKSEAKPWPRGHRPDLAARMRFVPTVGPVVSIFM